MRAEEKKGEKHLFKHSARGCVCVCATLSLSAERWTWKKESTCAATRVFTTALVCIPLSFFIRSMNSLQSSRKRRNRKDAQCNEQWSNHTCTTVTVTQNRRRAVNREDASSEKQKKKCRSYFESKLWHRERITQEWKWKHPEEGKTKPDNRRHHRYPTCLLFFPFRFLWIVCVFFSWFLSLTFYFRGGRRGTVLA